MAKLPGKTIYSGRRRPMTRTSGVTSHADTTGGEWDSDLSNYVKLDKGDSIYFEFQIPAHIPGQWIAFGGWFCTDNQVLVEIQSPFPKYTLTTPCAPDWSKFGSMWQGDGGARVARFLVTALENTYLNFWNFGCGIAVNPGCHSGGDLIECDSDSYLQKLYDISPEAHFWNHEGEVIFEVVSSNQENIQIYENGHEIILKSCNRCGRYLPINVGNEQATLSFSNHCVANRPCKHSTFARPRNKKTGALKTFEYGFQLECRFCKKYCVNWLLNRQRTAAQMKEDGARRRYFELLISELFQDSKQISFKHKTGSELTDYIWRKFDCKCFNCSEPLHTARDMNLDHTRPLALLWPLDETATALCGSCNSSKSDKFPNEFYKDPTVLAKLSQITGISIYELQNPTPNMDVVNALVRNLDWFFNNFLMRPEMTKERDGKIAAELVVKALQKTLDRCYNGAPIDLVAAYERHCALLR